MNVDKVEEAVVIEEKIEEPVVMKEEKAEAVVVNIKVKYIRSPRCKNLKDWINTEGNTYIGRGNVFFLDGVRYPPASVWKNPFKGPGSIELFEKHIRAKILKDNLDVESLRGQNLGCWCVEEPTFFCEDAELVCHGMVLLKILDEWK